MRLDESDVRFANFTAEQAYEVTRQAMTSALPPTAIISFSNFMTLGVIRAFTDLDRRCPDDVSLIGVDDLDWTDVMRLQPTLIAQPIEQMTRAAIAELLLQVEEGAPPSGRRILFPPKLIERSSCGPPPVDPSLPPSPV
jgi:DNA-binding LacI/PurR family transcriptional regulator